MQTTENFTNGIKKRMGSNEVLSWEDIDNNFKYGNSWQEGEAYKAGMVVWYNDFMGTPNNLEGEMSQWLCKSDHTGASGNTPGTDEKWERLTSSAGSTGPIGEQGPTGPQGEQGITGPVGEQGPTGDQGAIGEQGPIGDQGLIGDQGPIGPTGETGPIGPTGEQGPQGAQGIQGEIGLTQGKNYIMVYGTGTSTQNGIELLAAYNLAKDELPRYKGELDPALSYYFIKGDTVKFDSLYYRVLSTGYYIKINNPEAFEEISGYVAINNRSTVVIAPGRYDLGGDVLHLYTPYINVASLTGERDVIVNNSSGGTYETIYIAADNITVTGLVSIERFSVFNSLSNVIIKNCKGGDYAFGSPNSGVTNPIISSTFIDCEGGNYSFGYNDNSSETTTLSGTFINCKGGDYSFGAIISNYSNLVITGKFTNCIANNYSFGYSEGSMNSPVSSPSITTYGTFLNCTAGEKSFVHSTGVIVKTNISSGKFTNCIAGDWSFGCSNGLNDTTCTVETNISSYANFKNCTAGFNSFGFSNGDPNSTVSTTITLNVVFINCVAGNYSFGVSVSANVAASTTVENGFISCVAGTDSFGYSIGNTNLSGSKFYYCKCDSSPILNSTGVFFCAVGATSVTTP